MQSTQPAPQANLAWLARFIAAHKGAAIGSVVSGMVGGVGTAAEPYLIGIIIDDIRQSASVDKLALDVLLLIGLTLIVIVAFFGQRTYSGYVAYSVNFDIRRALFDNLLTLDQGFYQGYPTGDLISRMQSDVEMIWRLLALAFNRVGSALLTLLTAFLLLGLINLPLTLAVFVVLAISTSLQMRAGGA